MISHVDLMCNLTPEAPPPECPMHQAQTPPAGPVHQDRAYEFVECPMKAAEGPIDPTNMVNWLLSFFVSCVWNSTVYYHMLLLHAHLHKLPATVMKRLNWLEYQL